MLPPRSGLAGFPSAWRVLESIDNRPLRDLLCELVRSSGVSTAPGLKYLAGVLRCYANRDDYPKPTKGLAAGDVAWIERRARELLEPFVGDPRAPRMRPLHPRRVA